MNIERLVCHNALQLLVNKDDPTLFDNPEIFKKNMIDNGSSESEELTALIFSLNYRIPWEVRKHGNNLTSAVFRDISNVFSVKSKLNPEISDWVVDTWIAVLNLKKIDDKPAETSLDKALNDITEKVKNFNSVQNKTNSAIPTKGSNEIDYDKDIKPVAFDKIKGRFGIVFGEDSSGDVKVFNTWYNQDSSEENSSMAVTPVKLESAPVKPFKTAPKKKKENFSKDKNKSTVNDDKKVSEDCSSNPKTDSTKPVNNKADYKPTPKEQEAYNLLSKGGPFVNQALKILAPIAVSGSILACRKMGEVYYKGYGVMQNFEAAFKWLKLSADKEDSESLYLIGTMYQLGLWVKKDIPTAKQYFERAVKQGHAKAAESLKIINVGF